MSSVTERLREEIHVKTFIDVLSSAEKGVKREAARPGVELCLERARLITESYKETEGEPQVIRRAKALVKILENMTIYIGHGERIVGNFASTPNSVAWYPEVSINWLEKALNNGYRNLLDEEAKGELLQIHQYWRKNSIHTRFMTALPKDLKGYIPFNGASLWGGHARGLAIPNYEKLFRVGLTGLANEAEHRLREIDGDTRIHAKDYVAQKDFLEAVILTLKAVINFARRYAGKATDMASMLDEPKRQAELKEIARVCDWVPANPPRTFLEALQFFWFIHLIVNVIEGPQRGCGIRADVLFYPFYKKDVDEDRIAREEAQELMEYLTIKFEEIGFLEVPEAARIQSGGSIFQAMNIGGVDRDGHDVTNEMSYIVLDAAKTMKTLQPSLALRYNDETPHELLYKAIDVIRTGIGYPALFNDKVIIPHLLSQGIAIEDARNYSIIGCVQWQIAGKNIRPCRGEIAHLSLPKCLELALNQGVDKFSGKQIGYPTPDPKTFSSLEDIMEAYLKQVNFFTEKQVRIDDICQAVYEQYFQRPFTSALFDNSIKLGKDLTAWRDHSYATIILLGPTNVVDSLAAMKKLVFEEETISLEELLDALKSNFAGREELRQMLITKAPKFGNDIDYVDSIARDVHQRTAQELRKTVDFFGWPAYGDGSGTSANYSLGIGTGATPDGRKDREPFADAIMSPAQGQDTNGPTAVLKSVSRIDPVTTHTHLFNQKFLPEFLDGDYKKIFADYIRSWADLGIYHIQFNVVDQATLIDAKQHPEKHPNLIVRVAGYSAYFVDLDTGLQDDIIMRTEQSLGC